jgi:hypothetical protein
MNNSERFDKIPVVFQKKAAASYIPALRAMRLDPNAALHS